MNAPATPDSTTFPKGLAWGIPRLAAHGWALALALLVLALAPLAYRQPVAEAHATTLSATAPFKTSIDEAALRAPATPAQARQLSPLVHYEVQPGDSVDSIAGPAPPRSADRWHAGQCWFGSESEHRRREVSR